MNKELEALKKIREHYGKEIVEACWLPNAVSYNKTITVNDYCDIIETALKRLESVDKIGEMFCCDVNKKLKALEIIKEKQVNIAALLELDSLQQYNDYCDMVGGCKKLTQQEYDLLKEILK